MIHDGVHFVVQRMVNCKYSQCQEYKKRGYKLVQNPRARAATEVRSTRKNIVVTGFEPSFEPRGCLMVWGEPVDNAHDMLGICAVIWASAKRQPSSKGRRVRQPREVEA